jgi:hypothetical protein
MADARVDQLLREHQALERARAPYEADWRDIAHRLAPNLELWPPQDPSNTARQPPEIFDAPRGPLQRFAAALNGLLTPAGSKWHGFMVPGTKDDELDTYLEASATPCSTCATPPRATSPAATARSGGGSGSSATA